MVERFNKENKTSKQFQEWVKLEVKFQGWDDLMRYRWLKPMYNQIDRIEFLDSIPSEYFSFMENWDRENREYLKSKSYLNFLHEYSMYIDQLVPADTQKVYRELYETDFAKSMGFFPRYYQSVESGFIKDVLIAKFYYRMFQAKYYKKMKDIYAPELIDDALLRAEVQDKVDQERELYENPEFAQGSHLNILNGEDEFIDELTLKYPDKVLYIDFWAPWCTPCMGEMPHSGKLKKTFQGRDVVFVYLANRCEEAAWKSTIAEKKIEGEHFLLTDKQYAKLSSAYNITGIPHYILIDKKGNVVDGKASRPSSGEVLIGEIEELLQ